MDLIPTNEKPPRRFPLPCWGQNETLALIEAYRERWYLLRRGYLRTADWDSVATAVATASPSDPAKTSAQCRHKIEKLRQRYRAEKQRSLSLSSFSLPSSWFFFPTMDSMENNGPNPSNPPNSINTNTNNNSNNSNCNNYASVFRIKSVGGVEPVTNTRNLNMGFDQNPVNLGFRPKIPKSEGNLKSPNLGYACMDDGSDDDVADPGIGSGVRFRIPFEEKVVAPVLKAKKMGRVEGDYGASYGPSPYYMNGFNGELPPGFRVKGKMNMNPNMFYSGVDMRGNNSVRCEMNTDIPNGVPCYGYGLGKKSGGRKGVKRKRKRGAIDEIISSIKVLGEGYVRTEKMKMDMAREMEKTRMEMELKRNELILESQRQIVDAFVSVLLENNNDNNKKTKETPTTTDMPEEL